MTTLKTTYTGKTVNIMPKWRALVLHMLELYRLGGAEDQSFIREQFLRMAHAADLYIALPDTGLVETSILSAEGLRP